MSRRRTAEDLAREAAALRARADRLVALEQARELQDALKAALREGERTASKATDADGALDAFKASLVVVDRLRAVVGGLAGVDPLP